MVILTEIPQGSSSSNQNQDHRYEYDVFLSFRGADTRLNFTDHLLNALKVANLSTFYDDDEIETGLSLKPNLESAIRASRSSIIVLSRNYASSTWCLNELVQILDQHNNSNQIVIPIFYHVEPTDVRKLQSSFGEAMEKHKEKMEAERDAKKRRQWDQNMELWKKALVEVAELKGIDAKGRKETEFIEEIVTDIYRRLRVPLSSTLPLLIGMENSIEFVTSWLTEGSSHTAGVLTILGMSGIGKTSLAKYVYGLHCREFHKSSFINDIGGKCARDKFNGLLDLQKQLCGDIWKTSSINQVHDKLLYTSMLEKALAREKVFVVLDDIDSLDQLDALLGNRGLYPGSKIIITTKDASLTEGCALFKSQVQPKHTKCELKGLYSTESLELLCLHAFNCNHPKEGYDAVLEDLVKYCDGHPLALQVLGRSLHNQDVAYWKERIELLKKAPIQNIQKALQMSFDSLPFKNDKELFKHIAFFFVGMDRDHAETILNACNIKTTSGIKILIDRCLLSINELDNTLTMHQLLQEMGRDVVRQESPDKPWERSRLWCQEEAVKALKQKQHMKNLLGLSLSMRKLEKDELWESFELKTDALSNMDSLMLLQLNNVHLNGSYEDLPEELRWLCMHGFPLKSITLDSPMKNLVVLDMSYSNIESFDVSSYSYVQRLRKRYKQLIGSCSKEKRLLGSLKILDLSFCEQLHSLGGFFELPALEKLLVRSCIGLIEVCESIEQCVELVYIDLSYCKKLVKLPRNLGKLKKVKKLLLDGCNLGEFQTEMTLQGKSQLVTTRNWSLITKLSSLMGLIRSQTSSSIPIDLKLFEISLPRFLETLSLTYNNLSNESFPADFSVLSMLKELNLDGNPIISMPNCVRSLPRLEKLSMCNCRMLTSIEHPPCTLTKLSVIGGIYNNESGGLRRIVFDPEMSPLHLELDDFVHLGADHSSVEIEGVLKIQAMGGVEEKVLRSLGWTNLEFLKKSRLQMYYEFGIFSTLYWGKVMPEWISKRTKGPSISFTIPSSSANINKLRGLNFGFVESGSRIPFIGLPLIIISNITKKRTWTYDHYITDTRGPGGMCLIYLSHWMFGMNEMEGGDDVSITFFFVGGQKIEECGVGFVYEEEEEEEEGDALGYYKSWNHIIGTGGDLNAFRLVATTPPTTTTTSTSTSTSTGGGGGGGEEAYHLHRSGFLNNSRKRLNRDIGTFIQYKEKSMSFRAFSQKNKSTER